MDAQLTLDFGPPPPPCFDNFVAGANLECLATLRHLVYSLKRGETPAQRFFYVWGPTGSGKSHLAAALTASQCPNLMVVDDVDRYSKGRQRTLFHRFNALIDQPDHALVVFGNQPPARLKLLPELVSRLSWGMVFSLQPLDDNALADALEHLVRGIVDHPGDVTVACRSLRRGDLLEVRVNPDDLGRVIGRSGRTARALRTVIGALADAPVRVDVIDTDRH